MSIRAIVLDANILIRAVLGSRLQSKIIENAKSVRFFTPAVAYDDARKYLPALLEKRGIDGVAALKCSMPSKQWDNRWKPSSTIVSNERH